MTDEQKIDTFLQESNAIEGVYDEQSFKDAKEAWEFLIGQEKMTVPVVLETHKILMKNQPIWPFEKGHFRNIMVYVGGEPQLNAMHIPEAMLKWCKDTMNSKKSAKKLHVEYEKIHPFIDGNGRTGRMFMNWTLLKRGKPVRIIYEEDRFAYYEWFRS